MTRFTGASAALAIAVVVAGAAGPSARTGTGSALEQQPASRGADVPRGDVRNFIDKMLIAGMAEVQLGGLAITRAFDPDVRDFAEMMVKDHTLANVELQALASRLNLTPPIELDKKHRDLVDYLSNVRDSEFDREYIKAMVDSHQEVVNQLRDRTGDPITLTDQPGAGTPRPATGTGAAPAAVGTAGFPDDDPLTRWARKLAPTFEHHLERAKQLQQ